MLKLSKMADYGIVILAYMSQNRMCLSSTQIAENTHIPEATVSKILKLLNNGGIVNSTRGANGGYQLVENAENISAAKIIEAIDGPVELTSCVEGSHSTCQIANTCQLNGRWQKINGAVKDALGTLTLKDFVA